MTRPVETSPARSSWRGHRVVTFAGALALACVALAPARAQDAPRPGSDPRAVPGRNAVLERALGPVAAAARRHVVAVTVDGRTRGFGVVVRPGKVVTSLEAVGSGARLRVEGGAGAFPVTVVRRHAAHGVAVLDFEDGGAFAPIALVDPAAVRVGQFVAVVGTGEAPLAAGVVSAVERKVEPSPEGQQNVLMGLLAEGNEGHKRAYPRVLQHDGPTSAEVFGAPVVDRSGRLVGISVAAPYRGSSHAVDVDQIASVLEGLKAGKGSSAPQAPSAQRPQTGPAGAAWLGISGVPAPADRLAGEAFGVVVREVQGPAAAAGLQADDVIVALEGQPLSSMDAFAAAIRQKKPGDAISLRVLRGGAAVEVEVTLAERPR